MADRPGLLDANYRRVPGWLDLGRLPAVSAVVHESTVGDLLQEAIIGVLVNVILIAVILIAFIFIVAIFIDVI